MFDTFITEVFFFFFHFKIALVSLKKKYIFKLIMIFFLIYI